MSQDRISLVQPAPAEPILAEPMPAEPMPAEPMPAEPMVAEPAAPAPAVAQAPAWWILHAGPWVVVAAAVAFGVARGATAEFYRPLGITPDDAGVGLGRTLVQTFSLLGLLAVLLVSLAAVAAVAHIVAGRAAVPGKRRPAGAATPALVTLGPLVALTVEAWAIERPTVWGWAAGATVAVTAGLWVAAVRDPVRPVRRTVAAAAVGAAAAALVTACTWFAPTTTPAFLFAVFLVVTLWVALQGDAPLWRRARRYLPPLLLLSTVAVAVPLSRGALAMWLLLVIPFAALGAWLGGAEGAGRDYLAHGLGRVRLPDIPRLDRLVLVLGLIAACGLGTAAVWMTANRDGRHLLATGETRGLFAGQVFPARVMLRYDDIDPLGVCGSQRVATLVGDDDRAAYVLLRHARDARPSPDLPLVVPLPFESYVVTTGVAAPGRCVDLR